MTRVTKGNTVNMENGTAMQDLLGPMSAWKTVVCFIALFNGCRIFAFWPIILGEKCENMLSPLPRRMLSTALNLLWMFAVYLLFSYAEEAISVAIWGDPDIIDPTQSPARARLFHRSIKHWGKHLNLRSFRNPRQIPPSPLTSTTMPTPIQVTPVYRGDIPVEEVTFGKVEENLIIAGRYLTSAASTVATLTSSTISTTVKTVTNMTGMMRNISTSAVEETVNATDPGIMVEATLNWLSWLWLWLGIFICICLVLIMVYSILRLYRHFRNRAGGYSIENPAVAVSSAQWWDFPTRRRGEACQPVHIIRQMGERQVNRDVYLDPGTVTPPPSRREAPVPVDGAAGGQSREEGDGMVLPPCTQPQVMATRPVTLKGLQACHAEDVPISDQPSDIESADMESVDLALSTTTGFSNPGFSSTSQDQPPRTSGLDRRARVGAGRPRVLKRRATTSFMAAWKKGPDDGTDLTDG